MGHLKGRYRPNPLVETSEYCVEFPDSGSEEYAANLIAENIFAQVDDEGREHLLLDDIVNHTEFENDIILNRLRTNEGILCSKEII